MQKLEIGMSNNKGFTLIEILVVLFIIGITIGFALLAFGDFGAKRRVVLASEQFVTYVKLAQQQAILETSTLGITVNNNSYQASRYSLSNSWQLFPAKSIFRKYTFPSEALLKFQSQLSQGTHPQIVINESGDMNAFTLTVNIKGEVVAVIVGHHNGLIELEKKHTS